MSPRSVAVMPPLPVGAGPMGATRAASGPAGEQKATLGSPRARWVQGVGHPSGVLVRWTVFKFTPPQDAHPQGLGAPHGLPSSCASAFLVGSCSGLALESAASRETQSSQVPPVRVPSK